jgi:hypothetical protein
MTSQSNLRRRGGGSAEFLLAAEADKLDDGGETPRMRAAGGGVLGFDFAESERDREREFLDSLRSPDLESQQRGSVGGWGLGNWREVGEKKANGAVEDEDDEMDWDQAQAVVERMVGMKPSENGTERPETRRKVT